MIDVPVPPDAVVVILEAYLQVLEVSIPNYRASHFNFTFRLLENENSLQCTLEHWGKMLSADMLCFWYRFGFPLTCPNDDWL